MQIIKKIIRVGNSAGIVLPKSWHGGEARVELIKKPLNIEEDVLKILKPYLPNILGIYLVGSYARGEQTAESDVDVLVITSNINKRIEKGKYHILILPLEDVENTLKNNIIPLLPMLKEARPLMNSNLLEKYAKFLITKKNLKWHIETTKSALRISKEFIEIANMDKIPISDNIMYSLILRLRGVYIVDCLINNKKSTKKGFLRLIKKITGSTESYKSYIGSKTNQRKKEVISTREARKIYNYIKEKIKGQDEKKRKG